MGSLASWEVKTKAYCRTNRIFFWAERPLKKWPNMTGIWQVWQLCCNSTFNSGCVACWWVLCDLLLYIMRCYLLKRPFLAYCWRKKSCTTWLSWSPVNDGTFRISTCPGDSLNPFWCWIQVVVSKILLLTSVPGEMIGCGGYMFWWDWNYHLRFNDDDDDDHDIVCVCASHHLRFWFHNISLTSDHWITPLGWIKQCKYIKMLEDFS